MEQPPSCHLSSSYTCYRDRNIACRGARSSTVGQLHDHEYQRNTLFDTLGVCPRQTQSLGNTRLGSRRKRYRLHHLSILESTRHQSCSRTRYESIRRCVSNGSSLMGSPQTKIRHAVACRALLGDEALRYPWVAARVTESQRSFLSDSTIDGVVGLPGFRKM